jgi:hypothetical protein
MRKKTDRRVGVIDDQNQTFSVRRRSLDAKRWVSVPAVATEFRRNIAAFLKAELVIFILAPPAANEAVVATAIANAAAIIAFCIIGSSVETSLHR